MLIFNYVRAARARANRECIKYTKKFVPKHFIHLFKCS